MRASFVLKENIDTLLQARNYKRKDLAFACRRGESWISKIMRNPKKGFPVKYLDTIADFFGLSAYQLLMPGISRTSERRIGERRTRKDRRHTVGLHAPAESPSATGFLTNHGGRAASHDGPRISAANVPTEALEHLDAAAQIIADHVTTHGASETPHTGTGRPRKARRR